MVNRLSPMRLLTFLLLLLLPVVSGCEKESLCSDCVRLTYAQTQCADPWGYGTNGSDAEVAAAVRDFFVSNGVPIYDVVVDGSTAAAVCLACSCTTGKTIYVVTEAAYQSDFEYWGFY